MSYDAKTVRQMNKLLKIIGNDKCYVTAINRGCTDCTHRAIGCDDCTVVAKKYIVVTSYYGCPIRGHLNDDTGGLTALGKRVLNTMRSV